MNKVTYRGLLVLAQALATVFLLVLMWRILSLGVFGIGPIIIGAVYAVVKLWIVGKLLTDNRN